MINNRNYDKSFQDDFTFCFSLEICCFKEYIFYNFATILNIRDTWYVSFIRLIKYAIEGEKVSCLPLAFIPCTENLLLASLFSWIYLLINSFATALFAPLSGLSRTIQKFPRRSGRLSMRKELRCGSQNVSSHKVLPLFHQRTAAFSFLALTFLRSELETEKTFMFRPVSSVQSSKHCYSCLKLYFRSQQR